MLVCDICRQRPVTGYRDCFEWRDSAIVYCRQCAEKVPGIVWFDVKWSQPNQPKTKQLKFRFWKRDKIEE